MSGPVPTGTSELLADVLGQIDPKWHIKHRGQLGGGRTVASVHLVNYFDGSETRLGVLKIAASSSIRREIDGYAAARKSWFGTLLPEDCQSILLAENDRAALLMPLARDREVDCQMLRDAVQQSFAYGNDIILRGVVDMYAECARQAWSRDGDFEPIPLVEYFEEPIAKALKDEWYTEWCRQRLPSESQNSFRIDDRPEILPNPIAFLRNPELWGEYHRTRIHVPWIISHGDLNTQNVLCPTHQRAVGLALVREDYDADRVRSHLSFIDPPLCREAPFTYDPTFLLAWLQDLLLPKFESRGEQDIVSAAFSAVVDMVAEDTRPRAVHTNADPFIKSAQMVWETLRNAQPPMVQDLQKAFLASLAGANLWLAIKALRSNQSRPTVAARLCMGGKALQALLPHTRTYLPGLLFDLTVSSEPRPASRWTSGASGISKFIRSLQSQRPLVLVLGSQWQPHLDLPSDDQVNALLGEVPLKRASQVERAESSLALNLEPLGRLPLLAVLDWSVFNQPREMIVAGAAAGIRVQVVFPPEGPPDWTRRDTVFYMHARGELRQPDTLALSRPARAKSKAQLRKVAVALNRNRSATLHTLFVGALREEIEQVAELFAEVWTSEKDMRLHAICEPNDDLAVVMKEWNIEPVHGSLDDFVLACEDIRVAAKDGRTDPSVRILHVADRVLDENGDLVENQGQAGRIKIPTTEAEIISRAGLLLFHENLQGWWEKERDPQKFFIGHRVMFSEIHQGIPMERFCYQDRLREVLDRLTSNFPVIHSIRSQPGAGASTLLRWIAYQAAYEHHIPTLVLERGGNEAFEAIERLHARVGRSFLVVADSQNVPSDALRALSGRCTPSRYPAIFLTDLRETGHLDPTDQTVLRIDLQDRDGVDQQREDERDLFIDRLISHCPTADHSTLKKTDQRSMFLLTLDAFGGERVDVDKHVQHVLQACDTQTRQLIALIAVFSRYAHSRCDDEFIDIVSQDPPEAVAEKLAPLSGILLLRETGSDKGGAESRLGSWSCRHHVLTLRILQYVLTGEFNGDNYRDKLADLVSVQLLDQVSENRSGGEIAAEYVWDLLNPQLEAHREREPGRGFLDDDEPNKSENSRLLWGEDGLKVNSDRTHVFRKAANAFPRHVNIIAHFGKYLSEKLHEFREADEYLQRAFELTNKSESTIAHMLGKRYRDEVGISVYSKDKHEPETEKGVARLAAQAHMWFDTARAIDPGSEYNYVTAIQLDITLIKYQFDKRKILSELNPQNRARRTESLVEPQIAVHFAHAQQLVSQGLNLVDPHSRSFLAFVRNKLLGLRGGLDEAIESLKRLIPSQPPHLRTDANVQLAHWLHDRGVQRWQKGADDPNRIRKAQHDFGAAEQLLEKVLQDPAQQHHVRLWFNCARYLPSFTRNDLLRRLEHLHAKEPHSLEVNFYLMCLYFAHTVETGNPIAWRSCEEHMRQSDRLSSTMGIRTYFREWLVDMGSLNGQASELRVLPDHLFDQDERHPHGVVRDSGRVRLTGVITKANRSTAGTIRINHCPASLFFQPRVADRKFYQGDEGVTRVSFLVGFTYEKPRAFDVTRLAPE